MAREGKKEGSRRKTGRGIYDKWASYLEEKGGAPFTRGVCEGKEHEKGC